LVCHWEDAFFGVIGLSFSCSSAYEQAIPIIDGAAKTWFRAVASMALCSILKDALLYWLAPVNTSRQACLPLRETIACIDWPFPLGSGEQIDDAIWARTSARVSFRTRFALRCFPSFRFSIICLSAQATHDIPKGTTPFHWTFSAQMTILGTIGDASSHSLMHVK
jgi:hypothetical protein